MEKNSILFEKWFSIMMNKLFHFMSLKSDSSTLPELKYE